MKLKAEKSFYFNGQFIEQNDKFDANENEAKDLIRRGLAEKVRTSKKGE